MTIGERIKQRRTELNLSVDEVAEALGINRATLYRYESKDIVKFPTGTLVPLAKKLQTSPAVLMGWENEQSGSSFIVDTSGWEAAERYCEKLFSNENERSEAQTILQNLIDLNLNGLKKINERIKELKYIPDCSNYGVTKEDDYLSYVQNVNELKKQGK